MLGVHKWVNRTLRAARLPKRVCRAWHLTSRVKVPIPGIRRAEG